MKKISLIIIITAAALLSGCERKLPYDLDGITKGVLVSISKTPFSTYLLGENSTDGNYSVNLTIPNLQGDFSFMREVRLMCLFTPAANPSALQYVEAAEPIAANEFAHETPVSVPIDLVALCSRLGIPSPSLGDQMSFTVDVTVGNGTVLPGWTSLTGYTNSTFTYITLADGSSFQYNANYGAYAPFVSEVFLGSDIPVATTGYGETAPGTALVEEIPDAPDASLIPYGFTADDYHGRRVVIQDGWFGTELDITLWLNEADYTLLVPDQTVNAGANLIPSVGVRPLLFSGARGTMDTTNKTLTITSSVTYVGYGTWTGLTFVLTFP